MSNKTKLSIMGALASATCTLLGSGIPEPVQAQEEPGWDFNTALLYYGEDNDRVMVSPVMPYQHYGRLAPKMGRHN